MPQRDGRLEGGNGAMEDGRWVRNTGGSNDLSVIQADANAARLKMPKRVWRTVATESQHDLAQAPDHVAHCSSQCNRASV